MNRTQMASYSLLASAFVLTGLLIVKMQGVDFLPKAHADQVVTKANITAMTARSRNDEEALFILDNVSQKLLIYKIRLVGRAGRIELARSLDLANAFGNKGGKGGGNPGRVDR